MTTKLDSLITTLSSTCQPVMVREIASMALDAIGGTAPLPPVHFSGYAGLGKTYAVETKLMEVLAPEGWTFVACPVGCAPSVFNRLLVDYCADNDRGGKVVIFVDEIHALPKQTKNLLKIATETGGKRKSYSVPIGREEFDVTIDPTRHWFISASNESVRDSALVGGSGRFMELAFLPYDETGKATIAAALLPIHGGSEVKVSKDSFALALANVRPFARSIASQIRHLRIAARHGARLDTKAGMALALRESGYYPGGWTSVHIDILRYLAVAPNGRQVQEIARGPGKGRDRDTVRGLLDELTQGDLIITNQAGRKQYTKAALALLQSIDKARKPAAPTPAPLA